MNQSQSRALSFREITFSYKADSPPIFEDLSLDVAGGSFVSVVGPSGCGKTTLLRLAAGLLPLTSGEVVVNGLSVSGPSPTTGVVFQADTLLPWRTALRNVALGIETHQSKTAVRARCEEMLHTVRLAHVKDLYPHQLSGGMRQRVNLARALATDPEVLLMDEPFASLDAQTRDIQQQHLLNVWQHDRRTVLFVTHDIDEAVLLSDSVVVLGPPSQGIVDHIDVTVSRPRDHHVKTSLEFRELAERIRNNLLSSTSDRSSVGELKARSAGGRGNANAERTDSSA